MTLDGLFNSYLVVMENLSITTYKQTKITQSITCKMHLEHVTRETAFYVPQEANLHSVRCKARSVVQSFVEARDLHFGFVCVCNSVRMHVYVLVCVPS